ncbi:hypothetical protein Tco_0250740 [Tanacetum coccineum]
MSEVNKTNHSATVLALIKSQVPIVVDKYLGTKLDDALLKVLERHTADLIEKFSVMPDPESIKSQESKKSPKEIIRIKREQGEKEQESTYTIRSTDKVALEEFDLKSALFKHINKNISKKPHDSDASASKQHPTLTSTSWQITDTRDVVIDSSMHSSEPESGHSEHSYDDDSKQDEGHISNL